MPRDSAAADRPASYLVGTAAAFPLFFRDRAKPINQLPFSPSAKFPKSGSSCESRAKQGHRRHVEPDWAEIHRELKRKHVTLTMLWDEYIERCPEGYRYSRFCELYRSWASRLSVTMRQSHTGGDKLFVDYAGDTVPVIVDRLTGQVRPAQIFVAVMGASNFTYAEASWTQALADWTLVF